ncbi:growth arrest and DNA damage-inducible proteins-interacting protein 1 [Spea bombifrons]|uniref:growth arrest and DNA damage-inducible proteins-interacting protein 1 n=1 Tax=Spea bombifrons TaxID=233779 RepID=UPI00234A29C9|nr:growth arrest and DNA damage-inducible proteins-interacting protein 1 [Spea bombifrons]
MAAPMHRCWTRLRSLTLAWPAAGYHARPRVWGVGGVYKPDPNDPKTKEWQKGPAYEAKLYGRHGAASGVNPAQLWPSPERLQQLEAEEKEWYPSLQEMLDRVEAKERELQKAKEEKERIVAANLAKMPQMVADWRREKRELRMKQREEKERRERLLAQAREKFGLHVDYRSPKFQEMVKELEKQEKKRKKLLKRQMREEAAAGVSAAASGPATEGAS